MESDFIRWEGKDYARISAILKPFVNFSFIPEHILQAKATLGTEVHHYIDQDIKGNFPTIVGKGMGYCQSFHKWRQVLQPTFVETEMRYYCNQKMITGRIDTLIQYQGKEECILVDWKTSANESPKVWPKQAHLYHYLISLTGKKLAPYILFIKLDENGRLPKVFKYNFDTSIQTECFQAVDDFWRNLQ